MPNFARPSADTFIGDYTDELDGTTDIFNSVDEDEADDDDYIISPLAPDEAAYVCKLSEVGDPMSSNSHVVRYRYYKLDGDGPQLDLLVELREGYTDESDKGTLITSWTHTDISDTPTTAENELSGEEADSITDYSDLYLRFVFDQS